MIINNILIIYVSRLYIYRYIIPREVSAEIGDLRELVQRSSTRFNDDVERLEAVDANLAAKLEGGNRRMDLERKKRWVPYAMMLPTTPTLCALCSNGVVTLL